MVSGRADMPPSAQIEEDLKKLIDSGTSSNTVDTYRQAIRHFQVTYGGSLPALENDVQRYLATYAKEHSVSTLQVRLSALSNWHLDQGFADPTKGKTVKDVMKGIRKIYSEPPKKAKPITLVYLRQIITALDVQAASAKEALVYPELTGDKAQDLANAREARTQQLRAARDKAILLVGFWGAFRSDELARIEAGHVDAVRGQSMRIFLPYSKGDRDAKGTYHEIPALADYCPVSAYFEWLEESGIRERAVFRGLTRWGQVSDCGLTPKSLGPILRGMCTKAGISTKKISSHSMRRGFANWAADENWNITSVMEYVGWRSPRSAQAYIKPRFDFGSLALSRQRLSEAEDDTIGLLGLTIAGIAKRVD